MNLCRKGHASEETDYCSVCGVAMTTAAAPTYSVPGPHPGPIPGRQPSATPGAPAAIPTAAGAFCPDCGEARAASARFCEVCRFDFVKGSAAAPQARALAPRPPSAPPPAPPLAPPARASSSSNVQPQSAHPLSPPSSIPSSVPISSSGARPRFELVIATDPALDTEPDGDTPKVASETVVVMTSPELLVGRRDDRRDIHPDIAVDDPGASRRHAKFVRQVDNTLALQDLASTNGTKINDVDVPAGTRKPLSVGDAVTLGRWTRITVRSIS